MCLFRGCSRSTWRAPCWCTRCRRSASLLSGPPSPCEWCRGVPVQELFQKHLEGDLLVHALEAGRESSVRTPKP